MNSADLKSLSIGEPLWLLLLLIIPVVIWLNGRKKDRQTIKFSSIKNFNITQKSPRLKTIWVPKFMFYLGIILAIVSLSRPRLDQSTQSIISSGVDIVLGVDLSASMLALDMSPTADQPLTRLDVVKDVISDFIDKRKFDRIGLVAFAVDPYLVSALTLDKEFLQTNLARLRVGLTRQTGTNIGSVLAEGINRLRPLESKSKILILLTDGKDEPAPVHSPLIYAEGAKKDNIKIYTIAIGANTRTRTYLYDPNARDLMRYANGTPVVDVAEYPVDKDILQDISLRTDAQFFEAGDIETLRSIYDEIDKLEKTDVQLEVNALYEDLFQWTLALAFVFITGSFLLERTFYLRIP